MFKKYFYNLFFLSIFVCILIFLYTPVSITVFMCGCVFGACELYLCYQEISMFYKERDERERERAYKTQGVTFGKRKIKDFYLSYLWEKNINDNKVSAVWRVVV